MQKQKPLCFSRYQKEKKRKQIQWLKKRENELMMQKGMGAVTVKLNKRKIYVCCGICDEKAHK